MTNIEKTFALSISVVLKISRRLRSHQTSPRNQWWQACEQSFRPVPPSLLYVLKSRADLLSTNVGASHIHKFIQGIWLHERTSTHPRSERYFVSHRGWILIFVAIQIRAVLLIGWSKFSNRQKYYPDLRSDVSSIWSFCARFSDVISRGNRCWRREMSAVFSGEAGLSTRRNATLDAHLYPDRTALRIATEIYL